MTYVMMYMYSCIMVVQLHAQCAVLCVHCAAHQEPGLNMNRKIEWQKQQSEKLWIEDTSRAIQMKSDHSAIIIYMYVSL